MNNFLFKCITLLAFFSSQKLIAQTAVLNFEDELCTYQGVFNTKKFTKQQLLNTYELVRSGGSGLYTDNEIELDASYKKLISNLTQTKFAETPFFVSLKDSLKTYIEQTYKLKKIQFAAVKGQTSGLSTYYQDDARVKRYSNALINGGEELVKAYELLTKEQMKSNGAPQRLWDRFVADSKSPDKYKLAFNQVLVYGWWNSVNHKINHVNYDGRQFEAFKKLFIKVKTIDCDEP